MTQNKTPLQEAIDYLRGKGDSGIAEMIVCEAAQKYADLPSKIEAMKYDGDTTLIEYGYNQMADDIIKLIGGGDE